MAANDGIGSRIDTIINFANYKAPEIAEILRLYTHKQDVRFVLPEKKEIAALIQEHTTEDACAKENGRMAKHLFKKAKAQLDTRYLAKFKALRD
eukprot:COSAG04_NODE_12413_length_654_cov_0.704505_2_plen_93_part_01